MLRAPIKKLKNKKQMGSICREMETLRKNQKKLLKIKNTMNKNGEFH